MRKRKPTFARASAGGARNFPVSQRGLAAYLGVSNSLLSMANTGRHGPRTLGSAQLIKKADLELAHQQSQKLSANPASLKIIEGSLTKACSSLATKMLVEADKAYDRAEKLKRRLDQLAIKEKENMHWLSTVDLLLSTLPKSKETTGQRLWLEVQQGKVLSWLVKNGLPVKVKLEAQMNIEKFRSRVYRSAVKKLRKK